MAKNPFPLDQVQTQLVKPTTDVAAPSVAGPQQTGLSQGLAAFSNAVGSAAEFAKARQYKQDMKDAGLAAAKGEVAPGLVSEEAVEHNFNVLDENYVNDVLDQLKVHGSTHMSHLANDGSKTSDQKSDEIEEFLDTVIGHGLQTVTHNGEALGKLQLGVESYKRSWLKEVAQYEKQVLTAANIKNVIDNINQAVDRIPAGESIRGIFHRGGFFGQAQSLENAQLQQPYINIKGKKIKATLGLDAKKAVFQVYGDVLLDRYESNPIMFSSLVQEYKAFVKEHIDPLIHTENGIITSGKADSIGDDVTFKSIKDKVFTEIREANERLAKRDKKGHENWVAGFAREIAAQNIDPRLKKDNVTRQTKLTASQRYQVELRFPGLRDQQREIKAIEKQLLFHKYGKDSQAYREIRSGVIRRKINSSEGIDALIYRRALDPSLAPGLKTLMTENRAAITYNIEQIEKHTPIIRFSRILDSVESEILKKHIKQGLRDINMQEKLVIKFPSLERLVNRVSKLQASEEHQEPLIKAQEIFKKLSNMIEDRAVELAERNYYPRIKEVSEDGQSVIWKPDTSQKPNVEARITQSQITTFEEEVTSMYQALIKAFEAVPKDKE
tara:strand:+ start:61 stop:1890 length:1830 start_codon:yes stop_codon:yes gene_type:complete